MSLVNVKCPNCGASIQLDDSREEGFCSYCGSKVVIKDAINKVRIDKTSDVQNLLDLTKTSIEANNGKEALDPANKALEIDSRNALAWYYKMQAYNLTGVLKDLKCNDVLAAGMKAMEYDTSGKMRKMVHHYFLLACSIDLKFVTRQLQDTEAIKNLYNTELRLNAGQATNNALNSDTIGNMVFRQEKDIIRLRFAVPDTEITNDPQFASLVADIANLWVYYQTAWNERYKAMGTNMSDQALANYKSVLNQIKHGLPENELAQTSSEDSMDNEAEPTKWYQVAGGCLIYLIIGLAVILPFILFMMRRCS